MVYRSVTVLVIGRAMNYSILLMFIVLVHARRGNTCSSSNCNASYHHEGNNSESISLNHYSDSFRLNLLGFYPCVDDDDDEESIADCDVSSYIASEIALEWLRYNGFSDFNVTLIPIATHVIMIPD